LAVHLCIKKEDELMFLMIATIQKDLQSSNYLEVLSALTVFPYVVTAETLPALVELILKIKDHSK
jgi:AP-4 complex subunit epsilon-1